MRVNRVASNATRDIFNALIPRNGGSRAGQTAFQNLIKNSNAPKPSRRGYATYTSPHSSKPPRTGQPLSPELFPHRLKSGELTTGIPASEYHDRRAALMRGLPEGSLVVCMGGTVRLMSQQIFYKFRQATDFFYLTGFEEPDATLILESRPSTSKGYKYTLFVPPKDVKEASWNGECAGVEGAVNDFGADEAFPNTSLSTYLPKLLRDAPSNIYASLPPSPSPSPSSQPFHPPPPRRRSSLLKLFSPSSSSSSSSSSSTGSSGMGFSDTDPPHLLLAAALSGDKALPLEREVQKLRIKKSVRELALMRRAAEISSEGHRQVMRFAREGKTEAQVQAVFEYHCAMEGASRPAYVPVVASGPNALIIHYTRNESALEKDELVLIDAGCEYGMYASDITRTFPVSGRFTGPQRDLYTAVLNAQKALIKQCTVDGKVSMNELHRNSCMLLLEELRQIGFKLSVGDVERTLYPHFLSHHLGSDLHDCPTADRNAILCPGNVVTIEPGVYVPFDTNFPKAFHGLGIRIEDEVAFTEDGPFVLSAIAPKEIVDVEAACEASFSY